MCVLSLVVVVCLTIGPYDIIVATTKIINGNTLLKSCLDKEVVNFLKL